MEKTLVFTHRLDLALRLVDTTSGRNISGRNIETFVDGRQIRFDEKGDEILIFQSLETRRFRLEIRSSAYETVEQMVDLDALDKKIPMLELHMVPGAKYPGGIEFLTLEGTLPGIEELSAVRMGDDACLIREFDPRKRMAKIINPHCLSLDRVHYALVDPDQKIYEPFRILQQEDDQTLKVDRVLEMPFKNYFPITPLVFGVTEPESRYCLRVRDDAEDAKWLVRWMMNGEPRFRMVDFRETSAPRLEREGE